MATVGVVFIIYGGLTVTGSAPAGAIFVGRMALVFSALPKGIDAAMPSPPANAAKVAPLPEAPKQKTVGKLVEYAPKTVGKRLGMGKKKLASNAQKQAGPPQRRRV